MYLSCEYCACGPNIAGCEKGMVISMNKINRDDMLELTRRMTLKRNCFSRIAGAYLDRDGFLDGTFNRHFLKLSDKDRQRYLEIAKAIPFSETNINLKEHFFKTEDQKPGSIWQMLSAIKESELKNDAMLDIFYELFAEQDKSDSDYGIYLFYGSYDIPLKSSDGESLWESEEVYRFLICAVCPVNKDYEPDSPQYGFLFPVLKDRSSDSDRINIFWADTAKERTLLF